MQRSETAITAPIPATARPAEPATVSTPPWMEPVSRPERQPAEAAPATPAKSETKTRAPSPERDVCRRPERTIRAIYRPRPPRPGVAIRHPASVMIRRPAPGLVAYPGPAVIRLVSPVAIAIRSPAIGLVRNPHVAIVGNILPASVGVEVLAAGVVAVGVMPRLRVLNHVIAIAVPKIPVIAGGSIRNFVLRGVAVAANGCHLARVNLRAALRSGNLHFALAHDHEGVAVGPNFDAEHSITMRGMHGHVGRVDLRLGVAVFQNRVVGDSLAELNLDNFV